MEKKMNKLPLLGKILSAFVFVLVFATNISVFVATDYQTGSSSVKGLFTQASADGGESWAYRWSSQTSCPGASGSYSVCNENGSGNYCTSPGDVTCTCSTNCD